MIIDPPQAVKRIPEIINNKLPLTYSIVLTTIHILLCNKGEKMSKKMAKKRLKCDKSKSLHIETMVLFDNRPRTQTVEAISKATGLPIHWLNAFRSIKQPSVNRVQALYEHLSSINLYF